MAFHQPIYYNNNNNNNNNTNNKIYTDFNTTGDNMFTFLTEPKLIVPTTTITDDSTLSVCSSSTYSMTPTSSSSNNIDYQVWQSPCQSDYLGLTTFDNHSSNDFCVGDILDPNYQQQPSSSFNTSPAMTHHSSMMDSLSIQQHLSPLSSQYSDYWVSPLTPSMDSMDYYHTNNTNQYMMDQQQQQPDMMITPYLLNTPSPSLSSSPLLTTTTNLKNLTPPLMETNNYMNHTSTYQSSQPTSIKKKCKKIHYCPHCNHTSNRANNMKEHILTHDPNRPKLFSCHVCSKSFARKHDMKRHTKSHSKPIKKSIKRTSKN
ncbi:unnamed protein product [Cunninghamella blakesleeana]